MNGLTATNQRELITEQRLEQERLDHLALQWRRFAKSFLEGVYRRSESHRSRDEYKSVLTDFLAHYGSDKAPWEVVKADIETWLSDMGDVAQATYNQRLAIVSSFFGKAAKETYIDLAGKERTLREYNPAASIQRYKIDQYSRSKKISHGQLLAIIGQIDRATEIGQRDYALMMTYIYTGRRRRELATMTWGDIELVDGIPHYHYKGKGGKEKTRELPRPAHTAILDYLKNSGRLDGMTKDSPLWTSTTRAYRGKPMTTQAINARLKYHAENAARLQPGIDLDPAGVSLHTLRHAAAALRQRAGASVRELQEFLDHANVSTTQIYMESLELKQDERWRDVEAILNGKGAEAL